MRLRTIHEMASLVGVQPDNNLMEFTCLVRMNSLITQPQVYLNPSRLDFGGVVYGSGGFHFPR